MNSVQVQWTQSAWFLFSKRGSKEAAAYVQENVSRWARHLTWARTAHGHSYISWQRECARWPRSMSIVKQSGLSVLGKLARRLCVTLTNSVISKQTVSTILQNYKAGPPSMSNKYLIWIKLTLHYAHYATKQVSVFNKEKLNENNRLLFLILQEVLLPQLLLVFCCCFFNQF